MKREELPVIETHIPYGNRITGTAFASFSPGPGGDTPATAQNGGERKNVTIYLPQLYRARFVGEQEVE